MLDGSLPSPLPANLEIEQGLLGAIFVDRRVWDRVAESLRPDHFHWPLHGRIFEACGIVIDKGARPNPVTLKDYFAGDAALAESGGTAYLVGLATGAGLALNASHYAAQIIDLWKRRQIIALCDSAKELAGQIGIEPGGDAITAEIEVGLYGLAEARGGDMGAVEVGQAAEDAIAQAQQAYQRQKPAGVPTGIHDLDQLIGSLENGQLVIVAGRPSMGKTALAAGIMGYAAKHFLAEGAGAQPKRALEFELEMEATQMARRRLAAATGLNLKNIKNGWLSREDFAHLEEARHALAALPLLTDDRPGLTVADIRLRARRYGRRGPLGLIMVDHIGLVRPSRSMGNRVAEITEITAGLKELAKELNVPVLALSQLSRAVESRDDKRPTLADLRDSGSIEQDADVVMFVYREEYYLKRSEPIRAIGEKDDAWGARVTHWETRCAAAAGMADIIVAKQRDGETGSCRCRFEAAQAVFKNLSQEEFGL